MIRRRLDDGWLLITQNDHAVLSGQLAEQLGNADFAAPVPFGPTLLGIALHDSGWPLHDNNPTLNDRREPRHVFESTLDISSRVWAASAAHAEARDAYAGLLTSLHVLNLSTYIAARELSRRETFVVNKFQQGEIERQERLRTKLGLRTDLALKFGLLPPGTSAVEDQLRFDFRYLTLCDNLSLMLCFDELIFKTLEEVHPRPGAPAISILPERLEHGVLHLRPWPFAQTSLSFDVPCRRLRNATFADEADFRRAYADAAVESVIVALRRN